MTTNGKYRLLTRSDFDGLVCAMLLTELDLIDDIKFVHPKDVQDGQVDVTDRDILTNIPYVPACHLCFDHHSSEEERTAGMHSANKVLDVTADSAAEVVFRHFGGCERFPQINLDMLEAVNKADSARFTMEEVLDPKDWVLLSFLMDPRTGLGRFRDFRISNYDLMMHLISYVREHTIDEILSHPDVNERVELYHEHAERMKDQIGRCATVHDELVILDLRDQDTIWPGNRFMIYALNPTCNVSIHVLWGRQKQNTVFAIGKSIFDRSSLADIGEITLKYGGGGHRAAGTCQIENDRADEVKAELITALSRTGFGNVSRAA